MAGGLDKGQIPAQDHSLWFSPLMCDPALGGFSHAPARHFPLKSASPE